LRKFNLSELENAGSLSPHTRVHSASTYVGVCQKEVKMSKALTVLKTQTEIACLELVQDMRVEDNMDYHIYKGEYFALLTDGEETVLVEALDGSQVVRCGTIFRFHSALILFSKS
jgi:hypothetical protein